MATAKIFVVLAIASIVRAAAADDYIVGGQNARAGQFPSKVSLRTLDHAHFCGAAIVNLHWILTAAHCVAARVRTPNNMLAVANAIDRDAGEIYRIGQVVLHPQFNPQLRHNDVAMLRTVTRIVLSAVIRPSRLPLNDVPDEPRIPLYVAGLGLKRVSCDIHIRCELCNSRPRPNHAFNWQYPNVNGNGIPTSLQFMRTLSISRDDCRRALRQQAIVVGTHTLCAVAPRGHGVCNGDNGSPVFNQQGVLIGIVAWANGCGRGVPDVFTRINPNLGFIVTVARRGWINLCLFFISDEINRIKKNEFSLSAV